MAQKKTHQRAEKRHSGGNSRRALRVIIVLLVFAILITSGIVFLPRLVHHCDNCDALFFGTGYYANTVSNALSSLQGKEDKILCRECAEKNHSLEIAVGKSLDDFKRPLFETEGE